MDYFDVDHKEYAEARRRARLEREERKRAARRKRGIAFGLVTVAFALAFAGSYIANARARASARASDRAAVADAVPMRTPAPSEPPASLAATPAAEVSSPPVAVEPPPAAPEPPPAAPTPKPKADPKPAAPEAQRVRIDIGAQGYEPAAVRVKAGVPVTLTVGRGEGCAAGFLMPDLGIAKDNSGGSVTFRIGPLEPGTYRFTCGMEMVQGSIIAG